MAKSSMLIQMAAELLRDGKKSQARALLEQVISQNMQDENAWLWLSAAVDSVEEQRLCLENVLTINPDSVRARDGLLRLGIDPNTIDQWGQEYSNSNTVRAAAANGIKAASELISKTTHDAEPDTNQSDTTSSSMPPFITVDSSSSDDRLFFSEEPRPAAGASILSSGPFSTDIFTEDLSQTHARVKSAQTETGRPTRPVRSPHKKQNTRHIPTLGQDRIFPGSTAPVSRFEVDQQLYFNMIPDEIRPSQLPGSDESYSLIIRISMIILIVLNLGAFVFLILQIAP